jgi:hypothetical protein
MTYKLQNENYAVVTWTAKDVQCLPRCKNWSLQKCEEWLIDNEGRIEDRLTELGWEVLESFVGMEGDDE